jgi:probable O-glycosylation ligase (exosortase A-associated)
LSSGGPTLGVFLWIWVSVMSPHRLTWGFAHDFRWAYLIAVATLAGLLLSKAPKRLPVTPVTVVLALMVLWMTVTTYFAIDITLSLSMWERVMKILVMVFVALYLLHTKHHVQILICILAGSIAFYGIKGGLFTLTTGAASLVYGPPGSFIEENNALALATIMTIPLLYYGFLRAGKHWARWGLLAAMVLCGFSALGSHSRGGVRRHRDHARVSLVEEPRPIGHRFVARRADPARNWIHAGEVARPDADDSNLRSRRIGHGPLECVADGLQRRKGSSTRRRV